MIESFENLITVQFQTKMKPAALKIYHVVFPKCDVIDLRENGAKVHILDKEFGIDSLINLKSGQWITIQEKYRHYLFYEKFGADFTQEYLNAAGTKYENPGEWFSLGAQLYFYGWANKEENDFFKWALIDIAKYKIIVEKAGGLENFGILKANKKHGSANFYAFPINKIKESFIITYKELLKG